MNDTRDFMVLMVTAIAVVILVIFMGSCLNRQDLQMQLHVENMELIKQIK